MNVILLGWYLDSCRVFSGETTPGILDSSLKESAAEVWQDSDSPIYSAGSEDGVCAL